MGLISHELNILNKKYGYTWMIFQDKSQARAEFDLSLKRIFN